MEKKLETPSGDFLIRPYIDEDEKAVRSLWKIAFGKDCNPEIWRWKYHHSFLGRRALLCVTQDNHPVVFFSCLPYFAMNHGKKVRIGHALDSMSHPGYRRNISGRNGLFTLTTKSFFDLYGHPDDLVFIYGLPGVRHFRLGSILLNYTRLTNPLLYFVWPCGLLENRRSFFKGSVRTIRDNKDRLDEFAHRMEKYYPFSIFRDSEFLNWRYDQHPILSYKIFTYKSLWNKKINGWMATRLEGGLATIVDMLIPPDQSLFFDFLGGICRHLISLGITSVRTWLPKNHFLSEFLVSSGIVPNPEPFGVIPAAVARDFDPSLACQSAMKNLFYTMADGDLV